MSALQCGRTVRESTRAVARLAGRRGTRGLGSVSAAGGTEEAPRQALLPRTGERLGNRPPMQLFSRQPHDAIACDGIRGEALECFDDVAEVDANVAVVKLPARKKRRVSDGPTQEATTCTQCMDRLASAKSGHLTEHLVRCPRSRLELLESPNEALRVDAASDRAQHRGPIWRLSNQHLQDRAHATGISFRGSCDSLEEGFSHDAIVAFLVVPRDRLSTMSTRSAPTASPSSGRPTPRRRPRRPTTAVNIGCKPTAFSPQPNRPPQRGSGPHWAASLIRVFAAAPARCWLTASLANR